MSKTSKSEILTILRFLRKVVCSLIAKADKDTLNAINGEIGIWKKEISGRLKE